MLVKSTFIRISVIVTLMFVIVVLLLTAYRTSLLLNRYFPGFFVYHTRVINVYDIPEWWEGRKSNIPVGSILLKIDDQNINSTEDFWNLVFRNLDVSKEFKIEYYVDGKVFTKLVRSQKFEIKDFVSFVLFWQIAGILLLLLGIIIYLGNRSKKGELWLLATTLTAVNFITTPSSTMLSDLFIVTLVERVSFSLFPASIALLFLYFPLVKFRKQTRIIIISVLSSIGASFLLISSIGYIEPKSVAKFQEMYYFYPGIGGLFAVVMPIYDYIRVVRHKIHYFSKLLLLLSIGSLLFILVPSFLAILTTFFNIPSYYIPLLIVGYPILVISTLMVNSLNVVREISVDLSIMILISFIFSITFILILATVEIIPKYVLFTALSVVFIFLSFVFFSFVRKRVRLNFGYVSNTYSEIIVKIIDSFKKLSTFGKVVNFINKDFSKVLGFSFSKFISYKLIPKNLRRVFYLMNKYFLEKDELEEYVKETGNFGFLDLLGKAKYVVLLKSDKKFFGLILIGKKVTGDILVKQERNVMDIVGKVFSSYMSFLVNFMIKSRTRKILYKEYRSLSNILLNSLVKEVNIVKEEFSITSLVRSLDRPLVYKVKEDDQGVFFCIVWILPESLHTLSLVSIAKGMIEEYFFKGRINIHRLPREIRNIISSTTPIEVDANIVCGFIKYGSARMDVVNDGKTSIVLITKKGSIIPMPLHKRYFNFYKIKEGDRFIFLPGEEVITQIQEVKEMDIKKLNPDKFFYSMSGKFILEVKFHRDSQ